MLRVLGHVVVVLTDSLVSVMIVAAILVKAVAALLLVVTAVFPVLLHGIKVRSEVLLYVQYGVSVVVAG